MFGRAANLLFMSKLILIDVNAVLALILSIKTFSRLSLSSQIYFHDKAFHHSFNIYGLGCKAVGVDAVGCTLAAAALHNAGSVAVQLGSSTPIRASCSGSCYGRVAHKLALERCRLQVSES